MKVVVSRQTLDDLGMAIDFKDISQILEEVTSRLDHRNLDTLEVFREMNPTAENLAAYLYHETLKRLPPGVSLEEVEVSETDRYSVSYSE